MERGIIEISVESLPTSRLGEVQADHEIWEETDGGARVSGEPNERARVISEFCAIYGEPEPKARETMETEVGLMDVVVWIVG